MIDGAQVPRKFTLEGGNHEDKNKHSTQEGSHSVSHPVLIEKVPLNGHFNYNQVE